jgi:hypothetical protein
MRAFLCVALVMSCGKGETSRHDEPAPPAAATPVAVPPKHEDRHDPATSAPALSLEVTIQGTTTTWSRDAFDRVPHVPGKNNDGEARDVWSLRDLAHQLVGPSARIVKVTGAEATKTIAADAWADPSRTPILHTTRRGTLKFRWADKDGAWLETEVRDVARLEIVR